MELQHAGRSAEATELYRRVVAQDPLLAAAWWNLAALLRESEQSDAALDALEAFVRAADPRGDAFVDLARRELFDAGRTPPRSSGAARTGEPVQLIVERRGVRTLVLLDNDSGVEVDALQQTLESFVDAWAWMDAYIVVRAHPELTSSLALELLRLRAEDLDTHDGQVAQLNLRVLTRTLEAGLDVAFAEIENMDLDDFRLLVRGVDEIQPLIVLLASADEMEAEAILDAHPGVVHDRATDVLLWYLRRNQPAEGAQVIDIIRARIEARRR
ncbi:hypothetical protein [Cellulomonas cellasea]|nr:hypothetical protein [Cellulomonas cellasea]